MALAGYDSEKSMAMLPNVLNLAAAGNIELAAASDMVTDAQSALGLTMDQTSALVDKMAVASSKSNTSVAQLGDAILTVGGTAKNLAGGTTELATALGILADNGVKGSEGGTALRNVILSLSAPTDKAAAALTKLGVNAFDAQGNMLPLEDTFADLGNALSNLSQQEQTEVLNEIFNKTDLKSVNALLATSAERWDELSGCIDDFDGAAATMAETQLDNLAGDITLFQSALEGAQILVSDQLTPTLRQFTQFGTEAITTLSEAFKEGGLSGAMSALGTILSDALAMVIDMLPTLVDAGMQLLGALGKGILDNLPLLVGAAAQIIVTLVSGIGNALPELIPAVVDTVMLIVSTLIENLPLILDAGMQVLNGFTQGIIDALPMLVERLPELIIQIVDFLTESLPIILEQGSQMLLQLGLGIINAIPQLIARLPEIITSIVGYITENLPLLVEAGINLTVQLALGLVQAIPQLVASLPELIGAIVGGLADLPGMMLEIGGNVVKGVWDGIAAQANWIKEKVTGFFGGVVDGVKDLLGIHSPSTVFAGIGDNMALGLGGGFENRIADVTKDIENSIPTSFDAPVVSGDILYDGKTSFTPPTNIGGDMYASTFSDVYYNVTPIVQDVNTPNVNDVTYGVTPVIGDFDPPDTSISAEYDGTSLENEENDNSSEVSVMFSPVINITVQGDANEETTEKLKKSLYDIVKELYEEFKTEELEQMVLKNQLAF